MSLGIKKTQTETLPRIREFCISTMISIKGKFSTATDIVKGAEMLFNWIKTGK